MILIFALIGEFILKYTFYRPHFRIDLFRNGNIIGDLNHNGYTDLVLDMIDTVEYDQRGFYFYEFVPDSGFKLRDSIVSYHLYYEKMSFGGIGDFDNDGKADLIWAKDSFDTSLGDYWQILLINESLSFNSYPLINVWRDTTISNVYGIYDVNGDSFVEIFLTNGNRPILRACGDNIYCIVGYRNFTYYSENFGYGNLDADNLVDHVEWYSEIDKYYVKEFIDDVYDSVVFIGDLVGANIWDGVITNDMDQDGFGEAVLKDYFFPVSLYRVIIIEATGDNTYSIKKIFEFNVTSITDRGHSAAGDVDGDGIPEALIEMTNQIKIIEAFSDDSFYVWETINVPTNNEDDMWILIYDLDNNGINDIIAVTNNRILVYEWSTYIEEVSLGTDFAWFLNSTFIKRNKIGFFNIPYKNPEIKIFNTAGRKIYKGDIKNTEIPFDKGSGVYILIIRDKETGRSMKKKIIKLE